MLSLIAFLIVTSTFNQATAVADDNPKAEIFDLDSSDPQACQKLKALLKEKNIEFADATAEERLLKPACGTAASDAKHQTIILMPVNTPEKDTANLLKVALDANGGLTKGNDNYVQIGGTFGLSKRWIDRHVLEFETSGNYRSDKTDESTLSTTGEYFFMMSNHWAVFSAVNVIHDASKQIDFGINELAGLKFNLFQYTNNTEERALTFSAAVGHRYEDYADHTNRNTSILSYRVKLNYDITHHLRLITALWYQHHLYGDNNLGKISYYNMKDYRILLDMNVKVFVSEPSTGWNITLGLENEYFSQPPVVQTEKNDFRSKVGIGYTW